LARTVPRNLLDIIAVHRTDAVAIIDPDGTSLTYGMLLRHLEDIGTVLRRSGIGREDRVACVVSHGSEAARALLAVASAATCVLVHPSFAADEFDVYLEEVRAKAIVIDGSESSVRGVARRRGIPIIEVGRPNGVVCVTTPLPDVAVGTSASAPPGPDDTAVILRTSGTTGRPKRVPLTHALLCRRVARGPVDIPYVTAEDRCLCLAPLCYYAGFYTLLVVLAAGSSIGWPRRLDADAFLAALETVRPSWYIAAPPVHSAIIARAAEHPDLIARHPLRLIRSAAGELAPPLRAELERVFRAPVISTYATTETSRVAVNPLPPAPHKTGSLGRFVPGSVAILDTQGHPLPVGTEGEIGVRSPTVFDGYDGDPEATRAAFVNGWYRTGDLGRIDADGFLFLTDRIKDVINRGGTKVSPRAVEPALLVHPEVVAAAVFGMPHPTLGEDVAAAVVPQPGSTVTERDLLAFAAKRLSAFETPSRILLVERIPVNLMGKVQRTKLAEQLAPRLTVQYAAPTTDLECTIAKIWARELRVGAVGLHDNFFALGGDSLTALCVITEVSRACRTALPTSTLLQASTVAQMAELIRSGGRLQAGTALVAIRTGNHRPPLFCIHGAQGTVLGFRELADLLGPDQPVYGLQSRGLDGVAAPPARIEDMAAHYLREIEAVAPEGPQFLCGFSMGGLIALEMAQQLRAAGRPVALLAMLDTRLNRVACLPGLTPVQKAAFYLRRAGEYGLRSARTFAAQGGPRGPVVDPDAPSVMRRVEAVNFQAARRYRPRLYPRPVVLYLARRAVGSSRYATLRGWRYLTREGLDIHVVPGDHDTVLSAPREMAADLRTRMDRIVGVPS
jgi:oxalate---CoA ligase